MVRVRALRVIGALTGVGLVSAGTLALATAGHKGPARSSGSSTASNRRVAIRDARHLLHGVVPPAGAVLRSSGSAVGRHAQPLSATTASAVDYRSWTVPGDPGSVLKFVQAHLPPGSKLVSTGSGGPTLMLSVIRSWPARAGVLYVRWLYISASSRRHGGTLLYAKSESEWVVARPAGEHIPSGVREVDISEGWAGKPPFLSRHVTERADVHRLVSLFNSLQIAQPVAINCPAIRPTPTVEIEFRAGQTLQRVARASVSASADFSWPANLPGWECFPIGFHARGDTWPSLVGNVITPIQRLLHVKLAWHPHP
jgi:hypothetical protein